MSTCALIGSDENTLIARMLRVLVGTYGFDMKIAPHPGDDTGSVGGAVSARAWDSAVVAPGWPRHAFSLCDRHAASALVSQRSDFLINLKGTVFGSDLASAGFAWRMGRDGVDFAGSCVAVLGSEPISLSGVHAAALSGARRIILADESKDRARVALDDYLDRLRQVAMGGIDLGSHDPFPKSEREAYEDTDFLFASSVTSKAALGRADFVLHPYGAPMPHDMFAPACKVLELGAPNAKMASGSVVRATASQACCATLAHVSLASVDGLPSWRDLYGCLEEAFAQVW